MSNHNELAALVASDFQLSVPPSATEEALRNLLAERVNWLIVHDFDTLVRLLYRIDVSEAKLKKLLQDHPDADAGLLIAAMIIDRQRQKIESRARHRQPKADDDEERW
jgi:hypothetical protein